MFEIYCDGCGSELEVDSQATFDEYYKEFERLVNSVDTIVEITAPNYLLYKCINCESAYKLTYKEWEERHRTKIAEEVVEFKKQQMFREKINPQTIRPNSGSRFCGQCSGYFGDGNCLNDVIRQCTIRKENV